MGYLLLAAIAAVIAYFVFVRKRETKGQTTEVDGMSRAAAGAAPPAIVNGAGVSPWTGGVAVTVSQPKPTYADGGPDAWDEWDYKGVRLDVGGKDIAARLRVHFTDKEGAQTVREIDAKRFITDGKDGVLRAYCHLRQANRPFRLSRVTEAVDLDTGERIDNLPGWLTAKYAESPRGMADAFIDEHVDALTALFYVAKADGAFRLPERTVIGAFCGAVGKPSADVQEVVLQEVASWATPTAIGYGRALRAVATKPEEYRRSVLNTAQSIVDSDRTKKDAEFAALTRMAKEFAVKRPVQNAAR
jgi:hypothetical protein